jgi:hypothetical protein
VYLNKLFADYNDFVCVYEGKEFLDTDLEEFFETNFDEDF